MATNNLTQFALDLSNFAKVSVPAQHKVIVQKISFEVLKGIILKNPVGNKDLWKYPSGKPYTGGRSRTNWSVSLGAPSGLIIDATDKSGADTISKGTATIGIAEPLKQVIWVENNLPYIEPLENGHSSQAPAGMVELTLHEVQTFMDNL